MDLPAPCRPPLLDTWTCLLKVRRRVMDAVEADLKAAGLPGLSDGLALLQLRDSAHQALRPSELEKALEAPQYAVSRLIDRLERAGFVQRKACPVDGRSHYATLTPAGRAEIARFWPVYCASIETHLGAHLCDEGAQALTGLLRRIAPDPARGPDAQAV